MTRCNTALLKNSNGVSRATPKPSDPSVATTGQLTYGELDARAEALARRLRRAGVGPEARVGLWLGRSVELIVAMVARAQDGRPPTPIAHRRAGATS